MIPIDEIELGEWISDLSFEIRCIESRRRGLGHEPRPQAVQGLRNLEEKIKRARQRISEPAPVKTVVDNGCGAAVPVDGDLTVEPHEPEEV